MTNMRVKFKPKTNSEIIRMGVLLSFHTVYANEISYVVAVILGDNGAFYEVQLEDVISDFSENPNFFDKNV